MNRRQFVVGASMICFSAALGVGRSEKELEKTLNAICQKHPVPAMAAAFVKGDGTVICNAVPIANLCLLWRVMSTAH